MTITHSQRKFLAVALNAEPDRLRATWLAPGGSRAIKLGPVVDRWAPPPGADRVGLHRLTGDHLYRGQVDAQATVSLAELAELEPYWSDPLRSLNAQGRALAQEKPEPPVTRSFKLPPALDRTLERRARAQGGTVTAYLLRLIRDDLEFDG